MSYSLGYLNHTRNKKVALQNASEIRVTAPKGQIIRTFILNNLPNFYTRRGVSVA